MVVHCLVLFCFFYFGVCLWSFTMKKKTGKFFSISMRAINPETSRNADHLTEFLVRHPWREARALPQYYFAGSCFFIKCLLYGCSLLRTLKIFPLYRVWIYKTWESLIKVKKNNWTLKSFISGLQKLASLLGRVSLSDENEWMKCEHCQIATLLSTPRL